MSCETWFILCCKRRHWMKTGFSAHLSLLQGQKLRYVVNLWHIFHKPYYFIFCNETISRWWERHWILVEMHCITDLCNFWGLCCIPDWNDNGNIKPIARQECLYWMILKNTGLDQSQLFLCLRCFSYSCFPQSVQWVYVYGRFFYFSFMLLCIALLVSITNLSK